LSPCPTGGLPSFLPVLESMSKMSLDKQQPIPSRDFTYIKSSAMNTFATKTRPYFPETRPENYVPPAASWKSLVIDNDKGNTVGDVIPVVLRKVPQAAKDAAVIPLRKANRALPEAAVSNRVSRPKPVRAKLYLSAKQVGQGYYTNPPLETLNRMLTDDETLVVSDLEVGRKGFGSIRFVGAVNLNAFDLTENLSFEKGIIEVYPKDKPPVGQGLNTRAVITLHDIRPPARAKPGRFADKIKKVTEEQFKGRLLHYNEQEGVWKFEIDHL